MVIFAGKVLNFSLSTFYQRMKILLIEDDTDDVELLQEALKNQHVPFEMDVINDGSKAVNHFGSSSEAPGIIILDFNLPKIHGREVLLTIKSRPLFKDIPVLILTTSSSKEDIAYSYKHGADKYLMKPSSIEHIKEMVETIVSMAKN